MKKLTRNSLDELAQRMPVLNEELQRSFIGGGNGTKDNPYTETEFNSIIGSGSWYGGYVESWGYVAMETSVTPSGSYTPGEECLFRQETFYTKIIQIVKAVSGVA